MKKILSFLLVLTLVLSTFGASALAAETEPDASDILGVKEDTRVNFWASWHSSATTGTS